MKNVRILTKSHQIYNNSYNKKRKCKNSNKIYKREEIMMMFNISRFCINFLSGNLLAAVTLTDGMRKFWRNWYGNEMTDAKIQEIEAEFGWVRQIVEAIKTILVPVLSIVAAAGIVWAIVLGVQMARADSTDRREECKKRLIGLIVGIVVLVVVMMFFLFLFPTIMKSMLNINPDGTIGKQTTGGTTGGGTSGGTSGGGASSKPSQSLFN